MISSCLWSSMATMWRLESWTTDLTHTSSAATHCFSHKLCPVVLTQSEKCRFAHEFTFLLSRWILFFFFLPLYPVSSVFFWFTRRLAKIFLHAVNGPSVRVPSYIEGGCCHKLLHVAFSIRGISLSLTTAKVLLVTAFWDVFCNICHNCCLFVNRWF